MNRVKKSLGLLFPAMRISVALVLLTACVLLTADMLGYTLDEDGVRLENRKQIAESLAIQFSVMETASIWEVILPSLAISICVFMVTTPAFGPPKTKRVPEAQYLTLTEPFTTKP